mgnify:CR=1 FL=1
MPLTAWTAPPFALLFGCADGAADKAATDSVPEAPPATATWMQDLFAERPEAPLGRVLLPGAFNSRSYACAEEYGISPDSPEVVSALWASGDDDNRARIVGWAKTQGRSLGQQLEDGVRFLLISGAPIEEPVAWHGPIVMNTKEELRTAVRDLNNGTFIKANH